MTLRRFSELKRGMVFLAVCIIAWGGTIAVDGTDPATLRTHGILDWIGHVLTALIIAMGLWVLRLPIPIWSVLIGGVVLDLGHLLTFADLAEEIAGSSRNGSHSLIVVIAIALVGFIDRRHANVWFGIALGALSHVWPMMDVVWGTSFGSYLAVILGMDIALIGGGMLLDIHAKASHGRQAG